MACSQSGGKTTTVGITEVKRNSGRPFVNCIGGMTEAAVDGVGGCYFVADDAASLAAARGRLATMPSAPVDLDHALAASGNTLHLMMVRIHIESHIGLTYAVDTQCWTELK